MYCGQAVLFWVKGKTWQLRERGWILEVGGWIEKSLIFFSCQFGDEKSKRKSFFICFTFGLTQK